jgi:hypothetical protein
LGVSFAGFRKGKPHALGVPDDVAVSKDEAVSGDDHTGASAAQSSTLGDAVHADDRRADPVDDCRDSSRIGVEWRLALRVADRVLIKHSGDIKHGRNLKD